MELLLRGAGDRRSYVYGYLLSKQEEDMNFCEECGVLISPKASSSLCVTCDPAGGAEILSRKALGTGSELEGLPSTKSGAVRKRDSMRWLENLNRPSAVDLKAAVLPKPAGFTGSTFETDISNIRVTGDARFVETVAGLLQPLLDLENDETRLEINLQRTKVRDTSQYTGNYALYLSVAERSGV
jgi:hypothetical protein